MELIKVELQFLLQSPRLISRPDLIQFLHRPTVDSDGDTSALVRVEQTCSVLFQLEKKIRVVRELFAFFAERSRSLGDESTESVDDAVREEVAFVGCETVWR